MSYSRLIGHGATVDAQNNLLVIPLSQFLMAYSLEPLDESSQLFFIKGYLAANPDAYLYAQPIDNTTVEQAIAKACQKRATLLIYNDFPYSL